MGLEGRLSIGIYKVWGLKTKEGVKEFIHKEAPCIVMLQETKKEECYRRFVGSVWTVRNRESATHSLVRL